MNKKIRLSISSSESDCSFNSGETSSDDEDLNDIIARDRVILGIDEDEFKDNHNSNKIFLTNGSLRKLHKGENLTNVYLQIGEFKFMPKNEMFQVHVSDGIESSHMVCFDSSHNDFIKKMLNPKLLEKE